MLNYTFMGSPPIAAKILDTLCEKYGAPTFVVTQCPKEKGRGRKIQPTAVEEVADRRAIAVLTTEDVNDPDCLATLQATKPELILVIAFGQILKPEVLNLPSLFCLNLHASLLPKYRGAAPVQRAIWNGEPETGITIQRIVEKLDAGDILLAKKTPIQPDETSGDLLVRLTPLGAELCLEAFSQIDAGEYRFTPQDPKEVTYAKKIARSDALIDWSLPAHQIHCQIRALQPWPVAETYLENERLKIFRAEVQNPPCASEPGEIATDNNSFLTIQCGDGKALSLTEIQLENRKRLGVKDFLNAYRGQFPFSKVSQKLEDND